VTFANLRRIREAGVESHVHDAFDRDRVGTVDEWCLFRGNRPQRRQASWKTRWRGWIWIEQPGRLATGSPAVEPEAVAVAAIRTALGSKLREERRFPFKSIRSIPRRRPEEFTLLSSCEPVAFSDKPGALHASLHFAVLVAFDRAAPVFDAAKRLQLRNRLTLRLPN
jgi:hypothetical protein